MKSRAWALLLAAVCWSLLITVPAPAAAASTETQETHAEQEPADHGASKRSGRDVTTE